MSHIRRFVLETIPATIKALGTRLCGERVMNALESIWTYVLYKPNPIVQIVYVLVAVGGFYVYI
jgi:hypothetical protein